MNPEALLSIINLESLSPQQRLDTLEAILKATPSGASLTATPVIAPGVTVPVPTPKPYIDHGRMLLAKDVSVVCSACGKSPYKTVSPLYEHMTSEELCSAFTPPLTPDTQLWGDPYGNVAIDCPICNLTKTVWILGKGSYEGSDANSGYTIQSQGNPAPITPVQGSAKIL